MCLQLDVDTCIENTTWSTKTITNYHVEENTKRLFNFSDVKTAHIKAQETHYHWFCTKWQTLYKLWLLLFQIFIFNWHVEKWASSDISRLPARDDRLQHFSCIGFPWISLFWSSFLYSVFLFLLFVYILKICRLMDNKYRQERKLKIVS